MLVVRPAGPADLDHLLELAILSGPGFTSLPEDPDQLVERLDLSRDSFSGRIDVQQRWYTLMLEETDTGDVDGVGSVKAAVGLKRPFFSFRVVNTTQSSPSLNVRLEHQTLKLVNECSGWTEVGSLFLKADRRKGGAGGSNDEHAVTRSPGEGVSGGPHRCLPTRRGTGSGRSAAPVRRSCPARRTPDPNGCRRPGRPGCRY